MTTSSFSQRAALLLTSLFFERATGFVPNVGRPVAFRPLQAQVFMPDGEWVEEDTDIFGEIHALQEKSHATGLAEIVTKDQVASLARMAAAFSPPGQTVNIKDIEHVNVLNVDESHINIEAVICETDGCVTVAVPVDFPAPCTTDGGLQDCVLENIKTLDEKAETVLKELEFASENAEEDERVWQILKSTADMDLPTWWEVQPALSEECDNVRRLLNEDEFRNDIRALATKALTDIIGQEDVFEVDKAAIAAVCPAGVFLRVHAKRMSVTDEYEFKFLEVPLAFTEKANTAEALRSTVIKAVQWASSYV